MPTPLLIVSNLVIDVDVPPIGFCRAVDGISFEVQRGETLALVGESGCGKSLTLLAVLGLLPDRGVLRTGGVLAFDGEIVSPGEAQAALRGRKIGFVPQDPMSALNPVMTIGEQVAEGVRATRSVGRVAAREAAVGLLEQVGLPSARERFGAYPHELSGGQRQRVLIAMALCGDPELLVLDEPTTALDVTVQAQILALFRRLQRDRALGIVLVTHDLGVVARAADRVAVLYAGAIVESGPVAEVLPAPAHPYTRALLDAVPGRHRLGRLNAIPGAVPPPGAVIQGCRFRARCPRGEARCAREAPELLEVGGDRQVACHVPVANPAASDATP